MSERPLTDREQMLQWQQEQKVESQTVDLVLHYQALGVGLAVFCQAMYATLMPSHHAGDVPRFTQEDALRLVCAAVQGR